MEKIFDEKLGKSLNVIKHNTLIEAGYHLSPVPHNLMTLAAVKVKKGEMELSDHERTGEVVITADEYAKIHNIDIKTAYKDLKKAVLELENASLRCDAYYDMNAMSSLSSEQRLDVTVNSDRYHSNVIIGSKPKHGNFVKMKLHIKLVDRVGYSEVGSFVYFRFSDDVMYLIDSSEIDYTAYHYDKTIDMSITPTKRMYELACKWAKVGSCKKSVDDWRHFFGLVDKYEKIAEFKRWVIQPAIKGVNKQGDFELTLEQQKLGKIITHLIIKIKDKRSEKEIKLQDKELESFDDILKDLTEQERKIIAQKNAYADSINATPVHRQNLIKQALTQHSKIKQAEKLHQEKLKSEKADQQAQEYELLQLAQSQFELILADDNLIQVYFDTNTKPEYLRGLQAVYYHQGNFAQAFEIERYKFAKLAEYKRLELGFVG